MNILDAIGQKLLFAFTGKDSPSPEILVAIGVFHPAGVSLYRAMNIDHPAQVRELTQALQAAAREAGLPPLIIAADQEGGQLMAIGEGVTQLPGNLALGAAQSMDLARQAGRVLGIELAAMGINVDYAPCCDVNINPANPVVGTRSFGEDPEMVAGLAGALIDGMQSAGVAATAKHFPGHGDTANDSHHGVAVVPHDERRLHQVELVPFKSSIASGVKLVMSGHLALPALDGRDDLPATLSRKVLTGLLREELGFTGVAVTDAMNMRAIRQGKDLPMDAIRAVQAGVDLLLLDNSIENFRSVFTALIQAVREGEIDHTELLASVHRIQTLKDWLAAGPPTPDFSLVGCAQHQAVADEIAARSITLVRDRAKLLPLRLAASQRLAVILPLPQDLTPADTSSYVKPGLARALRRYHRAVDEYLLPYAPEPGDIAAVLAQVETAAVVVLGTINAFNQPGQAALARVLLESGVPTIVVALRMPYDLMAFPAAPTFLCAYSILEPSMRALAAALFGLINPSGRLPVSIPDLYALGESDS